MCDVPLLTSCLADLTILNAKSLFSSIYWHFLWLQCFPSLSFKVIFHIKNTSRLYVEAPCKALYLCFYALAFFASAGVV